MKNEINLIYKASVNNTEFFKDKEIIYFIALQERGTYTYSIVSISIYIQHELYKDDSILDKFKDKYFMDGLYLYVIDKKTCIEIIDFLNSIRILNKLEG